jgi:hypothetical protein
MVEGVNVDSSQFESKETEDVEIEQEAGNDLPEVEAFVVDSAFIVYCVDGHWRADSDLPGFADKDLRIVREATPEDFYAACACVQRDLTISSTAMATVQMQQQMAMQMAEASRQAQINQQISQQLHVPPNREQRRQK